MPNVLDAEPLRAFARRAAAKIADKRVADRFERLAFSALLDDARNFRAAKPYETAEAPGWVQRALERGEEISVFKLNRSSSARLHTLARRLADTCRIAATDEAKRPRDGSTIQSARKFIDTLDRASFEVTARKALAFSRALEAWECEHDGDPVCPERTLPATAGRRWVRVTSLSALRAVGREFHNCLARATRTGTYGGGLIMGLSQFWVLRAPNGEGLIVAMATAPLASHFIEVRGPRNARINIAHVDLAMLAIAIGLRPEEPPPHGPALALAAGGACRCLRCAPSRGLAGLRQAQAGH